MAKQKVTVGLVGAGRMGRGIGRNLIGGGFDVTVYDPDPAARAALVEMGAKSAESAALSLPPQGGFVITCLPDVATVQELYLGEEGLLAMAAPGTVFIDTTSSSPALTRLLGAKALQRGLSLVDAPLLRGTKEAWEGTVHVLLGGDPQACERCMPLLRSFSERVVFAGALGNGHALKALNNAISMSNAAVLGEAFHVASQLGFAPSMMLEVIQGGLADSAMLRLYGPRLLSGEHPRTGSIAFGAKDLGLVVDMARDSGAVTPVLDAAHVLYRRMAEQGDAAEAPSRLAGLLDRWSDLRRAGT